MDIKLVKYSSDKRPYVEQLVKKYWNGKKHISYLRRTYGVIKICNTCKIKFFTKNRKDVRPMQFCSKSCIRNLGPKRHWAIGKKIIRGGYIKVMLPYYPTADRQGRVWEHRYVMEKHIGRLIQDHEVIHHIDGNKQNNTIDNLRLMSAYDHAVMHLNEMWVKTTSWSKNETQKGWADNRLNPKPCAHQI